MDLRWSVAKTRLGLRDREGELFQDPRGWDPFREA